MGSPVIGAWPCRAGAPGRCPPNKTADERQPCALILYRPLDGSTDARAAVSLSTEELVLVLAGLPVFLPARQPLLAALRSADAAKFAGASLEVSLLIAGIREAAQRIEDRGGHETGQVSASGDGMRPCASPSPRWAQR